MLTRCVILNGTRKKKMGIYKHRTLSHFLIQTVGAFSSLISTTTAALLLLCIKEHLNSAEIENFDELLCKDHHDTTNIEGVIFYV